MCNVYLEPQGEKNIYRDGGQHIKYGRLDPKIVNDIPPLCKCATEVLKLIKLLR